MTSYTHPLNWYMFTCQILAWLVRKITGKWEGQEGKWIRGGKLVLITNRKSYINFQLVLKSVTLNDLDRRNGPYFSLFHRTRQLPRRIAPQWLKINVNILRQKCSPKHLGFSDISLTMIRYTWYQQFRVLGVSLEFPSVFYYLGLLVFWGLRARQAATLSYVCYRFLYMNSLL